MSRGTNSRTDRDSIKVNGEVRGALRAVIERFGPDSPEGARAAGILRTGSRFMSRRVLVAMMRDMGVTA